MTTVSPTESKISQKHTVLLFHDKEEIHNVAVGLLPNTPVSKLMYEGCITRLLVAEGRTTMSLSHKERFWLLLGTSHTSNVTFSKLDA